jgi:hypothetical protein
MPTLPTELIIEILKLYFHFYTPSTPLEPYDVPILHATSLRLVASTFDAIVSPLLFRSLTIITPRDFLRYFHPTSGVLVGTSEPAEQRRAWVKEVSLCLTCPDLPLKRGITAELSGPDVESWGTWSAPLSIPTFPTKIHLVDLPSSSNRPRYVERLERLFQAVEVDRLEGLSDWEIEMPYVMCEIQDELYQIERDATRTNLRRFLLSSDNNAASYSSISLLDSQVDTFTIIFGDRHFGFPQDPFFGLNFSDQPITYIYRASLLSSPPLDTAQVSLHQRSDDPSWVCRFPMRQLVNIRLVGYPVGEPAREALQEVLTELAGQRSERARHDRLGPIEDWRWIGENGVLCRAVG